MKTINEFLNFKKEKSNSPFNKDQDWKYWSLSILYALTYAFEQYNKNNKNLNPEIDEFPDEFVEDIMKFANNEEIYDKLYCLYRCYYAGDYDLNDVEIFKKISIK